MVGENGAGKSTLSKILGGAHSVDSGEILIHNKFTQLSSPAQAQGIGISIIYQEFNLIPELTIRENIFLGKEKPRKVTKPSHGSKLKRLEEKKKIGVSKMLRVKVEY